MLRMLLLSEAACLLGLAYTVQQWQVLMVLLLLVLLQQLSVLQGLVPAVCRTPALALLPHTTTAAMTHLCVLLVLMCTSSM